MGTGRVTAEGPCRGRFVVKETLPVLWMSSSTELGVEVNDMLPESNWDADRWEETSSCWVASS